MKVTKKNKCRRQGIGKLISGVLRYIQTASEDNLYDYISHLSKGMKITFQELRRSLHRATCNGFLVKHGKQYYLSGKECLIKIDDSPQVQCKALELFTLEQCKNEYVPRPDKKFCELHINLKKLLKYRSVFAVYCDSLPDKLEPLWGKGTENQTDALNFIKRNCQGFINCHMRGPLLNYIGNLYDVIFQKDIADIQKLKAFMQYKNLGIPSNKCAAFNWTTESLCVNDVAISSPWCLEHKCLRRGLYAFYHLSNKKTTNPLAYDIVQELIKLNQIAQSEKIVDFLNNKILSVNSTVPKRYLSVQPPYYVRLYLECFLRWEYAHIMQSTDQDHVNHTLNLIEEAKRLNQKLKFIPWNIIIEKINALPITIESDLNPEAAEFTPNAT